MGPMYYRTTREPWGSCTVVHPMVHGGLVPVILVYTSWVMDLVYWRTIHRSWGKDILVSPIGCGYVPPTHVVQPIIHGKHILHYPWVVHHSHSHGPWVVQHVVRRRMDHSAWGPVTLYGP